MSAPEDRALFLHQLLPVLGLQPRVVRPVGAGVRVVHVVGVLRGNGVGWVRGEGVEVEVELEVE